MRPLSKIEYWPDKKITHNELIHRNSKLISIRCDENENIIITEKHSNNLATSYRCNNFAELESKYVGKVISQSEYDLFRANIKKQYDRFKIRNG